MANILDDVLSPFRNFDIAAWYDTYPQIIDGLIVFPIFLGLAKFAFSKQFHGRPGNAIAVAISFGLTIALLYSEHIYGFSIKQFGWIAISIIIIMFGFVMFSLGKSANWHPTTAFAITYLITYLSLRSTFPSIFDYIAAHIPFINGILGLLWLVSLFMAIRAIARYYKNKSTFNAPNFADPHHGQNQKEELEEDDELKSIKHARLKMRSIRDIIDGLHMIRSAIHNDPTLDQKTKSKIVGWLREMSRQERIFAASYNALVIQFKKLGMVDADRLHRLELDLQTAQGPDRDRIEAQIGLERRKIEFDERITSLKSNLDRLMEGFNGQVNAAIHTIQTNPAQAQTYLSQAESTIQEIAKLADAADHITREILSLNQTQRQVYRERKKHR